MTDPRTIQSYDDFAEAYANHTASDKESPFHGDYEKPAIRKLVPDLHGKKVLALGCGSGEDAAWLKQQGADEVIGIDLSSKLIELATKRHPECHFQVMDMEKLEFEDESFDFAYSSLAMHYIEDWVETLSETRRVLKPNSLYVFSAGHPIDSGMKTFVSGDEKEKKLGKYTNYKTGERKVFGDYLALDHGGHKPIDGELLKGMWIRIYHRPISKMVEEIVASGFSIRQLVEPTPTEDMKTSDPFGYEYLRRYPYFLIWVLEKTVNNY